MANAKLAAVEKLKPFAPMLRALLDATDELQRVGSLEQAGDEAQARLDATNKAHDETMQRLAESKARLAEADQQLAAKEALRDRRLREFDADLATLREKQNAQLALEAEASRVSAAAHADTILADARAQAEAHVVNAKAEADGHAARADEAKAKLANLNAAIAEAHARHGELTRDIAQMRAKFL